MNDLTMGPLPAKRRTEPGRYGVISVYRCGVRDCPEVLGQVRNGNCFLSKGYERSRSGCYIKTRRAALRSAEQRTFLYNVVLPPAEEELSNAQAQKQERWNTELQRRESRRLKSVEDEAIDVVLETDVSDLEEKQNAARQEIRTWKRERTPFAGSYMEELPALVKCARCGRVSKIEGAE